MENNAVPQISPVPAGSTVVYLQEMRDRIVASRERSRINALEAADIKAQAMADAERYLLELGVSRAT